MKLKNKDQIKIFFPSNSEPVRCGQPPTLAWLELWEAAMEKASATMVPSYTGLAYNTHGEGKCNNI